MSFGDCLLATEVVWRSHCAILATINERCIRGRLCFLNYRPSHNFRWLEDDSLALLSALLGLQDEVDSLFIQILDAFGTGTALGYH